MRHPQPAWMPILPAKTASDYPARLSCPRNPRGRKAGGEASPGFPNCASLAARLGFRRAEPSRAGSSFRSCHRGSLPVCRPACLLSSRGKEGRKVRAAAGEAPHRRPLRTRRGVSGPLRSPCALFPSRSGLESFGASRCKCDSSETGAWDFPAFQLRGLFFWGSRSSRRAFAAGDGAFAPCQPRGRE